MLIPCGADTLPAAQITILGPSDSYAIFFLIPLGPCSYPRCASGSTLQPDGHALHPHVLPTDVNPPFSLFQHHVYQAFLPQHDGL